MRRILVTGMSGTGKSTVLAELSRRGYRVVDTDEPGWKELIEGEPVWREDRMSELLADEDERMLYVSGCVANQGRFYDRFDAVVLLSAPAEVILERIAGRATNPYGKAPGERELILGDLAAVEPLLRAGCTHELDATLSVDDVVRTLVGIGLDTTTVPTERSLKLQDLAQRVADALPSEVAEEVVLTGSVSRGIADEISDIEMLIVTPEPLELATCFEYARAAGLGELDTWGDQSTPARRVSGLLEGVSLELVWWSREQAESSIDSFFRASDSSSGADAIAHGVPLRTSGLLSRWQARLSDYPEELAKARIEDAALTWGGFSPAGLLTLARPRERLARTERMLDDAARVVRIVFALNRVWHPTHKRLAERVASLEVKPSRLAERIEEALAEPAARRALLVMTELQLETVALAPDGPNVNRARRWLAEGAKLLSSGEG